MRLDEPGEAAEVVAPFEQGEHPAAADLGGEIAQPVPPGAEPLLGDPHAAQGVVLPGVEAGREDQDVRSEAAQGGEYLLADRLAVALVPGPRRERHVES